MGRKLISVLVISILFLVPMFAAPVMAATEASPAIFPLFADQDLEVGYIAVWNSSSTVYVQYFVTAEDWYLTEVHVDMSTGPSDKFPVTKTGNPKVGNFEFSAKFALEDFVTQTAPIALVGYDGDVNIAAHAVVKHVSDYNLGETMTVLSDSTQWYNTTSLAWQPTVLCTNHPGVWATVPGAQWMWLENIDTQAEVQWEFNNVPAGGWDFMNAFTIPAGATNIVGILTAASDNAYQFSLNTGAVFAQRGPVLGADPFALGGVLDKNPDRATWTGYGTQTLGNPPDTYAAVPNLQAGANTLKIKALNWWDWGGANNPAGIVYKLEITYDMPPTVDRTETAWAAKPQGETQFTGSNWATYVHYFDCYKVYTGTTHLEQIDQFNVPASGAQATSNVALDDAKTYVIKAEGLINWTRNWQGDAQYWLRPAGTWDGQTYPSGVYWDPIYPWGLSFYGNAGLSPVPGYEINWGPYNASHVYYLNDFHPAADGTISFEIVDNNYGDNSGYLIMTLYEVVQDFIWICP